MSAIRNFKCPESGIIPLSPFLRKIALFYVYRNAYFAKNTLTVIFISNFGHIFFCPQLGILEMLILIPDTPHPPCPICVFLIFDTAHSSRCFGDQFDLCLMVISLIELLESKKTVKNDTWPNQVQNGTFLTLY